MIRVAVTHARAMRIASIVIVGACGFLAVAHADRQIVHHDLVNQETVHQGRGQAWR